MTEHFFLISRCYNSILTQPYSLPKARQQTQKKKKLLLIKSRIIQTQFSLNYVKHYLIETELITKQTQSNKPKENR